VPAALLGGKKDAILGALLRPPIVTAALPHAHVPVEKRKKRDKEKEKSAVPKSDALSRSPAQTAA